MKKLNEFNEHHARHIASLLKTEFSFSGYSKSENEIVIEDALNVYDDGKEKTVHIHLSGKVSFYIDDGEGEGLVLKEISQLPIIDYLRKEGFQFEY